MSKTSNYMKSVKESLVALADKIDPSGADPSNGKGDFYDVVITQLKRIADSFDNSSELPAVSGDDNGKFLGVKDGVWDVAALPNDLPTVSGDDDGKVLMVVSGEWAVSDLPSDPEDPEV